MGWTAAAAVQPGAEPGRAGVWRYLRECFLLLRVFAGYGAVVDACCAAWNRLVAEPDRLRLLCDQR
jgi:hypothetical protein